MNEIDFTYNKEEPLKREEETKEIIITNPLNYINIITSKQTNANNVI